MRFTPRGSAKEELHQNMSPQFVFKTDGVLPNIGFSLIENGYPNPSRSGSGVASSGTRRTGTEPEGFD